MAGHSLCARQYEIDRMARLPLISRTLLKPIQTFSAVLRREMKIRPDPWAAIDDPPADLVDPATSIRTSVTLIRRNIERLEDPTPSKVASSWNVTGRESVNDFGARVQDVYERRLWTEPFIAWPELFPGAP